MKVEVNGVTNAGGINEVHGPSFFLDIGTILRSSRGGFDEEKIIKFLLDHNINQVSYIATPLSLNLTPNP